MNSKVYQSKYSRSNVHNYQSCTSVLQRQESFGVDSFGVEGIVRLASPTPMSLWTSPWGDQICPRLGECSLRVPSACHFQTRSNWTNIAIWTPNIFYHFFLTIINYSITCSPCALSCVRRWQMLHLCSILLTCCTSYSNKTFSTIASSRSKLPSI